VESLFKGWIAPLYLSMSSSKFLLVTLAVLLQLNGTERGADIILLKGLDVMDKSASELSGYPYCSPNGVQNRWWKR
jgi:hypothetical protein